MVWQASAFAEETPHMPSSVNQRCGLYLLQTLEAWKPFTWNVRDRSLECDGLIIPWTSKMLRTASTSGPDHYMVQCPVWACGLTWCHICTPGISDTNHRFTRMAPQPQLECLPLRPRSKWLDRIHSDNNFPAGDLWRCAVRQGDATIQAEYAVMMTTVSLLLLRFCNDTARCKISRPVMLWTSSAKSQNVKVHNLTHNQRHFILTCIITYEYNVAWTWKTWGHRWRHYIHKMCY